MKKLLFALFTSVSFVSVAQERLSTTTGHIKFFSTTAAENIEANNYKVVSAITPETGKVVFSVPMQSFEFEKALMQKHFNSDKFLDTKQFPTAKFKGSIQNIESLNLSKNGSYDAVVLGDLTLHGITKPIKQTLKLKVENGKITGYSNFDIALADYNIVLPSGKPTEHVAKTVNVTVDLNLGNTLTASK